MTVAEDLKNPAVYPSILIEFDLPGGELSFWHGPGTITIEGRTYVQLSGFDSGLTVIESLQLASLSSSMRMAGLQPELQQIFLTEEFQNSPARIWMAAFNIAGTLLSRELIFDGTVENAPINQEPRQASQMDLEMVSVMGALFEPYELAYTPGDQEKISAGDTFFNAIK